MKPSIGRLISGLVIIGVGIGFLLNSLNIIELGSILSTWWPLFIVGAGLLIFINDMKNYIWSLGVIAIGALFQLRELDVISVNPWQLFWPIVIIFVGINVLKNHNSRSTSHLSASEKHDATAILSGSDQKYNSKNFKGGKLTAVMGGVVYDLRGAKIQKEAVLELFAIWGGIEIRVPKYVIVRNNTSAILGGTEANIQQEVNDKSPTLYITGDVIMAGVEIKN